MTELMYFDNDCLSAFLWVKAEQLLVQMYPGKIVVPQQVYNEISLVPHLKAQLDAHVSNSNIAIPAIEIDSAEYKLYNKLAYTPDSDHSIIGKGEAAVIALASVKKGIVASNNLKDIATYVEELNLKHTTTPIILADAFNRSIITEADGNNLWSAMLAKKRKLGSASFSDYLAEHSKRKE